MYQNVKEGTSCFPTQIQQPRQKLTASIRPSTLPLRILRKPETCFTKVNSNTLKVLSHLMSLRTQKKKIYLANLAYGQVLFFTDGIYNFKSNIGLEVDFNEKSASHAVVCLKQRSRTKSHDKQKSDSRKKSVGGTYTTLLSAFQSRTR